MNEISSCVLEASDFRHALGKLSNIISRGIIIAHNKDLSFAVLAHADAEMCRVFPHHLGEVSRAGGFRLNIERVLVYLVVPSINGIFAVHFMVGIRAVV